MIKGLQAQKGFCRQTLSCEFTAPNGHHKIKWALYCEIWLVNDLNDTRRYFPNTSTYRQSYVINHIFGQSGRY